MPDAWLKAPQFAHVAGITRQAAAKALAAAIEGRRWRGHALEVRRVLGRGGKSGLCYEVSEESLSAALEHPLSDLSEVAPTAGRRAASKQATVVGARWTIIEEAAARPAGSRARAEAIIRAAAKSGKSARTIERWLAQYENHGLNGLARKRPSNAGMARVAVSRIFDQAFRAAGYDEALLAQLGSATEQSLKGLWASRAEAAGWAEVGRLAEFLLMELCETKGVTLPEAAFRLSRRHVERFAHHRVVNQYRNDRKAFDDAKPRIRRDWTSLAPMERIVGDVKHLDVIVQRADGSAAWPKIVGFLDAGTGRMFAYPLLLEPGEGVRQEHVIEAFIAMTMDPEWGFPLGLYLDNGSEFKGLDKIRAALDLVSEAGARTIIRAKPYNASAKPVESHFRRLDKYVFALLPGYVGGDRMSKKTQTVGKPPAPFPGDWDQFCENIQALIRVCNYQPMGGLWAGRSPAQVLQEKIAAGWAPVRVDPLVLDAAFCDRASRRIDRGIVSINGTRYYHPQLAALPARTEVAIALPWRRGADPLFQAPGGTWAYLEQDYAFPANWTEGAQEAGRRQRAQVQHVKQLAKVPAIDPVEVKLRKAARLGPVALHGRPDQLDAGAELLAIADGRARSEQARGEVSAEEARRRRARDRETARLEKRYSNAV